MPPNKDTRLPQKNAARNITQARSGGFIAVGREVEMDRSAADLGKIARPAPGSSGHQQIAPVRVAAHGDLGEKDAHLHIAVLGHPRPFLEQAMRPQATAQP